MEATVILVCLEEHDWVIPWEEGILEIPE